MQLVRQLAGFGIRQDRQHGVLVVLSAVRGEQDHARFPLQVDGGQHEAQQLRRRQFAGVHRGEPQQRLLLQHAGRRDVTGGHLGGSFSGGCPTGGVQVVVPGPAAIHPAVLHAPPLQQRPTLAHLLPYRSQAAIGVVPIGGEGVEGGAGLSRLAFPRLRRRHVLHRCRPAAVNAALTAERRSPSGRAVHLCSRPPPDRLAGMMAKCPTSSRQLSRGLSRAATLRAPSVMPVHRQPCRSTFPAQKSRWIAWRSMPTGRRAGTTSSVAT